MKFFLTKEVKCGMNQKKYIDFLENKYGDGKIINAPLPDGGFWFVPKKGNVAWIPSEEKII